MADDDARSGADDAPNNVRSLMGRIGFNPPSEDTDSSASASSDAPTLTLPASAGADGAPADDVEDEDDGGPLDMLTAMREPGLAPPESHQFTAPQPGYVPDTFRAQPADGANHAPRLGALSAAAILAVSVAALRGIHSAVTAWRANREQRQVVDRAANGGKGKGGRKKDVPSTHEYGRKSLGGRSSSGWRSSGGGRGGGRGGGPGRTNGGGRGSGGKSPGRGRGGGRTSPNSSSSRNGGGRGSGSNSSEGRSRKDPKQKRNRRPLLGRGSSQRGDTLGRGSGKGKSGSRGKGRKDSDAFDKAGKKNRRKAPRGTSGSKGLLTSSKKKRADEDLFEPKKSKNKSTSSGKNKGKSRGRTTLRRAMRDQRRKWAKDRFKQRRKNLDTPFLWSNKPKDDTKNTSSAGGPKKKPGGKSTSSKGKTGASTSSGGAAKKGSKDSRWEKTSSRARKRWEKRRAEWRAAAEGDPFDDGGNFWVFGTTGGPDADSPFAAAAAASQPDEHRVERMNEPWDRPSTDGDEAKEPAAVGRGQPALGAAPTPHTERPGTSAPEYVGAGASSTKEKESPMAKAGSGPGRAVAYARAVSAAAGPPEMSPEHETEITLPEALELLEKLTQDGFAAHDMCVRLAKKAREIRHKFEDLAVDLKTRHNIIGRLTAAAMEMFAEAMEVVARKAEEMQVTSLIAAELSEVAETAMFDAYQPIQQATEDAGLSAPSAYVHNRE